MIKKFTEYEYKKDENPEERLRNLLSPYIMLVDILDPKKMNDPKYQNMIINLVSACKDNKNKIEFFLSDIKDFYSEK